MPQPEEREKYSKESNYDYGVYIYNPHTTYQRNVLNISKYTIGKEEYCNDDEYDFNSNRGNSPIMYQMRIMLMLWKINV